MEEINNLETVKKYWRQAVIPYQKSIPGCSLWQLANSLVPFIFFWVLMAYSLRVSYWLTLALAVPAAGFLIRIFIIFHDCGHGSFFKSLRANRIVGYVTGVLTFTPYEQWTRNHAIHHATAGDLDRRGVGDVKVLTVKEYQALPWWKKVGYRIMRQPLFMFTFGALLVFVLAHRFPSPKAGRRELWSVVWTDLALTVIIGLLSVVMGFNNFLLVHLPIMAISSSIGVWMFYVQHQFDGVYWERHDRWDFVRAGMEGSSFYQLPGVLQWFTGNIGFHHIHHLSPRIPNYLLARCYRENPIFQQVRPLTLLSSLKSLRLRLWDEENHRLVGFGYLKT